MRPRRCTVVCLAVLLAPIGLLAQPMPPADISADEALLRDVGIGTDGDVLLKFFRQRTLTDKDAGRIDELIKNLSDRSFRVREASTAELIGIGSTAQVALQQAAKSKDPEVAMRARRCLKAIEQGHRPETLASAARVVAVRKPAGAAAVLLEFLPNAPDSNVKESVRRAIAAVGVKDGNPDPILLTAITDRNPEKRAAAVEALLRGGTKEHQDKARKALDDPNLGVRFITATTMVELHDKSAVEPLIGMLPDLVQEDVWRAEAMLYPMAGDNAPQVALGSRAEERQAYRDAWLAWWKKHGAALDLAKIAAGPRYLGRTLLLSINNRRVVGGAGAARLQGGSVTELGPDGKARWSFTNVEYPIDAQSLGDDRILLAEYRSRKVSERNSKGEELWSKVFNTFVMGAQRLPNGKTLVCTGAQVLEVDRQGQESVVFTGQLLRGARRLRNGQMVVIERNSIIVRLDAAGKELGRFNVTGSTTTIMHRFDILPNGNVLVPQYAQNKVVEYDETGKVVWQTNAERPTAVTRLPNGNTLITSYYSGLVREVTKAGTEVWKYQNAELNSLLSAIRR